MTEINDTDLRTNYTPINFYKNFILTVEVSVYKPWRYHKYYVSDYPRYYYHNTYRDRDFANIRGFNENNKNPVYWQSGERDRIKDLRKMDRPVAPNRMEPQKQPQKTNYYGKPVGQSVKVTPVMKPPKEVRESREKKEVGGIRSRKKNKYKPTDIKWTFHFQ